MLNLLVVLLVQKYCTKTLHALLYVYITYYIYDQCMYLICKLQYMYMYYMLHQLPVLGAPL